MRSGRCSVRPSPTNGDRFMGFARMERDTVTGLNLAVFREENPGTGRWDSQDPLGVLAGDQQANRYCGNNPVGGSRIREGLQPQSNQEKSDTDLLKEGLQYFKDHYKEITEDPELLKYLQESYPTAPKDGLKMGNITFGELKGVRNNRW